MAENPFSLVKFARGAFWVLVACGVGIGAVAAQTDWSAWQFTLAGLVSFGYAVARSAVRWYVATAKQRGDYYEHWWLRLLVVPLLCALVLGAGCVSSSTREQSIDADGSSYNFHYRATSAAAPFGKVSETVHQMVYQGAGESGGSLTVGQDSAGIDNTGQIEAIRAAGEITGQVVAALIQGGLIGGGSTGGATGGLLDRLQRLEATLDVIQSLLSRFGLEVPGLSDSGG